MARHLAFSQCHVHAARPDNDVHGGHGLCPVGHGGHRLGPSHRIHGINPGHSSSGQSHVGDSAISSGRNAEDNLVHPGHPRGYGSHQDGGGVGSSAAGGVAARPLHRTAQGADNQAIFLGSALGPHLADVVASDSLGRYLQCLQDPGLDAARSGGNLGGVNADCFQVGTVETGGHLQQGDVSPLADVGQDGPDLLQRSLAGHRRPGENRPDVLDRATQVEPPEHPVTLPAVTRRTGRAFRHAGPTATAGPDFSHGVRTRRRVIVGGRPASRFGPPGGEPGRGGGPRSD